MADITIPKKLNPIVQAFFAESPQAAKKLIIQAAQAIYGSEEEKDPYNIVFTTPIRITNEHLEDICAFMHGIKPNDVIEAIIAAQIVVTHMLGMRKLAKGATEDQRLGLKMLKFSGEAMGRLHKKRCGGVQNINIHYHGHGTHVEANSMAIPVHPMI